MLLKQVDDVGATLAWYPSLVKGEVLMALGTKEVSGSGFDDYGASLEVHKMDLSDGVVASRASGTGKKSSSRFMSLSWSALGNKSESFPLGLIAGGMSDGGVDIWDPAKVVAQHPQAQVSRVQKHKGAVNGLQFNPHASNAHLLASGGADNEVFITALERPEAPQVYTPAPPPNPSKHTAEVTRVAWNSQVSHILATASQNGVCVVWDLRQKRAWCELRDASRDSVSDVCWNPAEGLHVATASGDDAAIIRLWDLRSSTTMPLGTLRGHAQGVLSMSWCPTDTSLLVSCGRDNKTFVWDFFDMNQVYELPEVADDNNGAKTVTHAADALKATDVFATASMPSGQSFGSKPGFGGGSAARRYQVAWAPAVPAVLATCSFDRKVHVFSMAGAAIRTRRGPAWLRRPCGCALGFGGKLAKFVGAKASHPAMLKVSFAVENRKLIDKCCRFEHALANSSRVELCAAKAAAATNADDKTVWEFMRLIFEPNAREQLLSCLGYDVNAIAADASQTAAVEAPAPQRSSGAAGAVEDDRLAEDVFSRAVDEPPTPTHPEGPQRQLEEQHEALVKRALLVGNFDAAVDACLASRQLADALLLASCGGAELWEKTRRRYFDIAGKSKRPFLDIVSAIITNELGELVAQSRLNDWQETLAVVSTYGKSDDFAGLCEQLGQRLEKEAGLPKAAALCYMCAVNVPKTIEFWINDFRSASDKLGKTDVDALEELIERVAVFARDDNNAAGPLNLSALGPEITQLFAEYAGLLASQGQLEIAARYCAPTTPPSAFLLDRLHVAAGSPVANKPFPVTPIINAASQPTHSAAYAQQSRQHHQPAAKKMLQQPKQAMQPQPSPFVQRQVEQQQQPSAEPQLPPPWISAVDPSSGRTYYANPQTGITQWEFPVAPASTSLQPLRPSTLHERQHQEQPHRDQPQQLQPQHVQPQQLQPQQLHPQQQQPQQLQPQQLQPQQLQPQQLQPQQLQPQQLQPQQMQPQLQPAVARQTGSMDLAVQRQIAVNTPAATMPGSATQFQPQATMNQPQLSVAAQPQPQATVFQPQPQRAPTQATAPQQPQPAPVPAADAPLPAASSPVNAETARLINEGLAQLRSFLSSCPLNTSERRQLVEIDKSIDKLAEKLAAGAIENDVGDRTKALIDALTRRDFATASSLQVALVNTDWASHKDWLRNIKLLQRLVDKYS